MAALPDLITVAQFQQLPERDEQLYELHHGELVAVTYPKGRHTKQQWHLGDLLRPKLKKFGRVVVELPYSPTEFELRAADIAAVSKDRWKAISDDDYLRGAPELVIEIKSPSNTKRQLQELATMTLGHGALEFWVVDLDSRSVSVTRKGGSTTLYSSGAPIPLTAFDGGELAVDEIFV